MKQSVMFGENLRCAMLTQRGDPLAKINQLIDWEMFRAPIEAALRNKDKGPGGRPPYDFILLFKILFLEALYDLSDDQVEYQIIDRYSFSRFLHLTESDRIPDAKTIWLFREKLTKAGIMTDLFMTFKPLLNEEGYFVKKGSIVDASFVEAPRQRNTREENQIIKNNGIPEDWKKDTPEARHKIVQKDVDARWVKKNKENHYGYKDHAKVDVHTKLITDYTVTSAEVHDSKAFPQLVTIEEGEIYADSAYSGCAKNLPEGSINCICKKGCRYKKLTEADKERNHELSKTRSRIEHVFGFMTTTMRGLKVRCIGMARASLSIGLQNLTYNICRYSFLNGKSISVR